MEIRDLKESLERESNDREKTKIISRISALVDKAEKQIRGSQKEIQHSVREWSIELVNKKYSEGLDTDTNELFIPDYQRGYKWEEKIASRFIESLLLGFPIPYMYIADVEDEDEELDGRVEIIDGSQRIRALHYFLSNQFYLKELKELTNLEGFYFSDLPAGRKRRFLRESLRLVELTGSVDESHRRDLFDRINSGVKRLLSGEVRHGSDQANSVFYRDVIEACADDGLFSELAPLSDKKRQNGDHRELVLRFFAYLNDLENYGGRVDKFLDAYLEKSADEVDEQGVQEYLDEFKKVMEFVDEHIAVGFRKTANSKTTTRARFEAISVGIALALRSNADLTEPAEPFNEWLFGEEFHKVVSADSANNTNQLKSRINFVKDKVLGINNV